MARISLNHTLKISGFRYNFASNVNHPLFESLVVNSSQSIEFIEYFVRKSTKVFRKTLYSERYSRIKNLGI